MTLSRSLTRRAALATIAAAAALVLAACGGTDHAGGTHTAPAATASTPASAGQYNQADVTFAQQMIPHHRQAVAMAEVAETRASSDEVKSLADKIKQAQDPEINTMSGWLTAWGKDVPQDIGMDHEMPGMDHGDASSMPGMMGSDQMGDLDGASGKAFDTMFLTMMIEHHQGAIDMAKTEKNQGAYAPAKALAGDIVTAQTAEITQMRKMLDAG
ncbi:DUF305 domain-containing protein [Actinacidiphila glaucinigra]|uniref:DUF305 domain-containing protein n=1 Tax=Actinacidiphila glaucinigra TaxID=235986 RepID=UPI00371D9F59